MSPRDKRKILSCGALHSKKLARVSDSAERLYWRVYMASDNYGTMAGDAWDVQAAATAVISGWGEAKTAKNLDELANAGLLARWTDEDGETWIHVVGHDRHQSSEYLRKRGVRKTPKPPSSVGNLRGEPKAGQGQTMPEDSRPPISISNSNTTNQEDPKGSMSDAERPTPPKPQKQSRHSTDVQAVWEHWLKACGHLQLAEPGRAKLTKGRASHIRARLSEGYSVDDLIRSISGFAKSSWHRGDDDKSNGPYLEPKTILKSGEQVEAGWAYGSKPAGQPRAKRRGVESDWSHLTGGGAA